MCLGESKSSMITKPSEDEIVDHKSPHDDPSQQSKHSRIEKYKAIRFRWWRKPVETVFPDKVYDGHLQHPASQQVFDFDHTAKKAEDPFEFIKDHATYYPAGNNDRDRMCVFVPGLGQTEQVASDRSRRYADRMDVGIANLNNGSFLRANPCVPHVNGIFHIFDWVDATVHRVNLSSSPVINKCAYLIIYAMENQIYLNLSADSHGTILLARALRGAKKLFMQKRQTGTMSVSDCTGSAAGCLKGPCLGGGERQGNNALMDTTEHEWEELSRQYILVYCFGNSYRGWVKGPKYLMIHIARDYVTFISGTNPKRAKRDGRPDIHFLVFDAIFPWSTYESHNMMFTIELMRQTFVKNNLTIGDFPTLYDMVVNGTLEPITAEEVKSPDFPWPEDIMEHTWTGVKLPGTKAREERTKTLKEDLD